MVATRKLVARAVAAAILLVGIVLIVERGGILAWVGAIAGIAMLVKCYLRPSRIDVALGLCAATIWALAWAGTIYYVISTWESGEVVQLAIETHHGPHTARVWILDTGESPVAIYDAPPQAARALMSGNPLKLTRAGEVSVRHPKAIPADKMPEAELNAIYRLMDEKYGERNFATSVYYTMLGRMRNRVLMIVTLNK